MSEKALENHTIEFDGIELPATDETDIVRCVHEGVCPTCGEKAEEISSRVPSVSNPASFTSDDWDVPMYLLLTEVSPWDDRMSSTVQCANGHKATAEPTLSDWTGWIGG